AVEELAQLRELLDGADLFFREVSGEAEQGRGVENVGPAREHHVQARAQLDQAEHAPADLVGPLGRLKGAGDHFQQRALARPVGPDDAQALAAPYFEAHAAPAPELGVPVRPAAPLDKAVHRLLVDLEASAPALAA